MNKRRGKYKIEPVYEYVDGLDSNYDEVIKEEKLVIHGRFSVDFWCMIQQEYKMESLSKVIGHFGNGLNLAKMRDMVYYSHIAWVNEVSRTSPDVEPVLKDLSHAANIVEQFAEQDIHEVTEALIGSQMISELLKASETLGEEMGKKQTP